MMKKAILFLALLVASLGGANAQAPQPAPTYVYQSFTPTGRAPDLAATNGSSTRVALGLSAPVAYVCNTGLVTAYVKFGNSAVTASTTADTGVQAGACITLNSAFATHLAGRTASSSATVEVTLGTGSPSSRGGGGGGSGSGITSLTGDVTATGPGAAAATLVTAQPGAHTWAAAQTFRAAVVVNLNATTAPTPITGTALQVVGADAVVGRVSVDSFGTIAAFTARRANGTAAAPTALASNDQIGGFNFYGWYVTGGPAYGGPAGSMQGFATQAWTSTAFGTRIVIATTPNNSTTLTTALTIDQDQSVVAAGRISGSNLIFASGKTITINNSLTLAGTDATTMTFPTTSATIARTDAGQTFTGTNIFGVTQATSLAIGGATIGSDALAVTGTTTHVGNVTLSGTTLIFSGNISAAAWTTTGIRHRSIAATLTDTTSSGTVAAAYSNAFGGNTIAASSGTTYTNYFTGYFNAPVAGTNVTFTNSWALGAASIKIDGNGALSAPAFAGTGTWITAGSATTTKPYFLIEPAGTTSTGWSTSGTGLGVNATGAFVGNLLDLQLAGVRALSVDSTGRVRALESYAFANADNRRIDASGVGIRIIGATTVGAWIGNAADGVNVSAAGAFAFSSNADPTGGFDVFLRRDAANTLAIRNGTTAQRFNLYTTFTDASNYERLAVYGQAGAGFIISADLAGSGVARNLTLSTVGASSIYFNTTATDRWQITASGHFIAPTDNTYDIGAVGATRPRSGFFGTNITAGSTVTAGTQFTLTSVAIINSAGHRIASNLFYGWSSATDNSAVGDTFLTRPAAATVQHGAADADTNAAIVAQTIRTQGALAGGTADQAGKNFTIDVSPGKGTGAGGSFIVRTAPAGASSTVQGTLVQRLVIDAVSTMSFQYGATTNDIFTFSSSGTFQVGSNALGTRIQAVTVDGTLRLPADGALKFNNGNNLGAGALDVALFRGAAGILRQVLTTAAQKFEVYNTSDANAGTVTNYERGVFDWQGSANLLRIGTEAGGTGVVRSIVFVGGAVGVGTVTAPGYKLEVKASGANVSVLEDLVAFSKSTTKRLAIIFRSNDTEVNFATQWLGAATTGDISFSTNDTGGTQTERFRLTTAGLATFGGVTSSFPAIKRSTTVLQFKLADDSAFTSFTATTGILNALASDTAQVTATVCAESTTGQLYKGSGTLGICLGTSSARYKDNVVPIRGGLAEVALLQPVNFYYRKEFGDGGAREQYGFLAEDMVKVLPKLVGLDAKERPNTIDMLGMVPLLVKAIQELKADNDNMRAEMAKRAAAR